MFGVGVADPSQAQDDMQPVQDPKLAGRCTKPPRGHWCARGADTDGDPSGKFLFGSWPRTSDENDRPTGDNAATGRPSPDKPDRRRGARADWYTGARRSS